MNLLREALVRKLKAEFESSLRRAYEERWPNAQPLKFIHAGDAREGMISPRVGRFTEEQRTFVEHFKLIWGIALERLIQC